MRWVALAAWVATAAGGFTLLALWLRHGGMAARDRPGPRIKPPLLFSHFGLAAAGLVVWIVYVASDEDVLAWIGFAALIPVALLGFTMLALWLQRRRTGAATAPAGDHPAEQRFPVPLVAGHGALAVATLVLVLLTAAGVGD